jgi:hypothetical protein
MSDYLNTCLNKNAGGTDPTEVLKAIDNGQCLDPSQASSFPVPPRSTSRLDSWIRHGCFLVKYSPIPRKGSYGLYVEWNGSRG